MCELLKPTKNYLRLENTTKLVYICHASLRNKVCFFVSLLWLMSFLYVQILKVVQCYRSSKQNNMYKTLMYEVHQLTIAPWLCVSWRVKLRDDSDPPHAAELNDHLHIRWSVHMCEWVIGSLSITKKIGKTWSIYKHFAS